MKQVIIAALAILFAISATSCKKEYSCSCYSPSLNRSAASFDINDTRKNAEDKCKDQSKTGIYTGTDYVCNLK